MTDAAQRRWLRKLARDTVRERMRRARAAVVEARKAKRTAGRRARFACKKARGAFTLWVVREREHLRTEIERLRVELRGRIDARRAGVRKCCGADRQRTRAEHDAKIAATRATLDQLRDEHRRARIWSKPDTLAKAKPGGRREAHAESESAVTVNLSPDELIVWERVKSKIAPSGPRMSRLERFQHWLHEHPGEVARILEEDATRALREAVKNEQRERKAMRGTRTERELAEYLRRELAEIPF